MPREAIEGSEKTTGDTVCIEKFFDNRRKRKMIQKRVNQESLATKAVSEAAEFQLSNEALDFLVDLLMNIDEGGTYYELDRNLEDAA